MSVTVRLYSDGELDKIKNGTDKLLSTIFMNGLTFSEHEMTFYPYGLRRTFLCEWNGEPDLAEVYATDVKALKEFLKLEYTRLPDWISEKTTRYKSITL